MKSKIVKKILIVFAIILVLIQLIPGDKNVGEVYGVDHVSNTVNVPSDVDAILKTSCYDCHSNNTVYPWYTKIQPVRLWLDHHIDEGKHELNFSEFKTYKLKRQIHKMDEVVETVESHEMPLSSYTIIHKDAVLNEAQKKTLIDWAKASMYQLQDTVTLTTH